MTLSVWLFSVLFLIVGTVISLRKKKACRSQISNSFPITVLKPLCGSDPGLRANLESIFLQKYPEFEIIFSVSNEFDSAISDVMALLDKYPQAKARLVVGGDRKGLNPKVNNLIASYELAKYEVILISDSNVRVRPDYLSNLSASLSDDMGVLTSVVAGVAPSGIGGALEATYLNTFYARAMNLAFATGNPFVMGKSMMFRKSTMEQIGGIESLSSYIAEDYAFGEGVLESGLKIGLTTEPIPQHIGAYSFESFWNRHTRWGKIRKAHAPWIFLAEPLSMALPVSCLAGVALSPWLSFTQGFLLHFGMALLCDVFLTQKISGQISHFNPLAWILREILAFPLWIASILSNTVNWRGHELTIQSGGKLEVRNSQCKSFRFFGVPLRAPIKLRGITKIATGGIGRKRAILREG